MPEQRKRRCFIKNYESTTEETEAWFHEWGTVPVPSNDRGDLISVSAAIVELKNTGEIVRIRPEDIRFERETDTIDHMIRNLDKE